MFGRSFLRRVRPGALLALAASATACTHATRHNASRLRPIERGDRVVVEQTAAEFFQGRVLSVSGGILKIQTADQPDSLEVHVSDTYRLPPAAHSFSPNDLAVCEMTRAHWKACRIDVVAPRMIAEGVGGHRVQLSADRVLAPTPVTRLNLRRAFQIAHTQAAFRSGLLKAGRPRAPAGWTPHVRDHVLAALAGGWYSATVREVRHKSHSITVIVRGDQRVVELPDANVVPEPPYSVLLLPGNYALTRPVSLSQPWKPVRATSATADAVHAVDIDGNKLTFSMHDVVPLVKR